MKIFKIKFDSKDPTDRSISVKKGDDFGIAIQIDNQQSQGPTTITYGGQTISADTELVAGYNTFLLKGLADEKISVKDIDSQVIFTLNILAKDSDVVELGGTGSGGDSVWQADEFDYYIDGALSVNNCQKVTITGNKDQVILKGLCDDASYEIENGNLILNTPKGIQINSTGCNYTTPYIGRVTQCGSKTSFIEFDTHYLNLTYDSGCYNNNAININGCGICIDAQQGELYLNSSDSLNICAGNLCITAGCVSINSNSQFAIYSNGVEIKSACGSTLEIGSSTNYICINSKSITIKANSKNIIEYCGNYIDFGLNNVDMCINGGYIGVGSSTFGIHSGRIVLGPNTHSCVDTLSYDLFGNFDSKPNINFPRGTFTFEGVGTENGRALRTKSLAIVLSAVECALLASSPCDTTLDDSYATEAFNKLTSIFSA